MDAFRVFLFVFRPIGSTLFILFYRLHHFYLPFFVLHLHFLNVPFSPMDLLLSLEKGSRNASLAERDLKFFKPSPGGDNEAACRYLSLTLVPLLENNETPGNG